MHANEPFYDGDEPPLSAPLSAPSDGATVERWQALLALNAAALIWGSQHAVIKGLVESIGSPAVLNAARFSIAAAASLPWLPGAPWRECAQKDPEARAARTAATWTAGAELGMWTFLGFGLQAISLQYTTATRSAFLLYLNVKLVPILALVLYGRRSPLRTWLSAAIAFTGTALISFDGSPPNIGDAWSLAAALASACFILRLEEAARETQPAELNAAAITSAALLSLVLAAAEVGAGPSAEAAAEIGSTLSAHAGELLYLALFTTAVAQWLQTVGQSRVGAQESAIIFSLDPVYGAGFSWLLLGESFGATGWAGGALIVAGVLLSQTGGEKPEAALRVGAARSDSDRDSDGQIDDKAT